MVLNKISDFCAIYCEDLSGNTYSLCSFDTPYSLTEHVVLFVLHSDVHTNSIEWIYSPLKQIFKIERGKYLDTFHTLIPHDTVE